VTDFYGALAGALVVVVAALAWALFSRRGGDAGAAHVVQLVQQQIEAVRTEGRASQDALRQEVAALRHGVASELQGVTSEVARQLQDGMRLIQAGQTTMGERLDHAAKVVGDVQGSLGKLGEVTQRVVEVGRDLQGLEQILKAPKIRGGLGETLLEQLLAQMLPADHYVLQHGFKTGDKVDAALRIGGRLVPVDAKFPLENFQRMLAEPEEERRRPHRKSFTRDVKLRVDEIAKKYILPDEGTYDFALMYVPAENVYYEIILKDGDADDAIAAYALSRRVVPVSPNSLYAYLQVIILGLRGLRIEANAREIQNDLIRLGGDITRVREHMDKLGTHLTNAQKQFTDAARDLARFEAKLEAIERKEVQPALPEVG
jgi:DNA recombination protein RmuC